MSDDATVTRRVHAVVGNLLGVVLGGRELPRLQEARQLHDEMAQALGLPPYPGELWLYFGPRCEDCGVKPGFTHAPECTAHRANDEAIDVTPPREVQLQLPVPGSCAPPPRKA